MSVDEASESAFLASYRKNTYPKPSVTVDLLIFTVFDSDLKVLLIERDGHPFQGHWALPGGFVDVGDGYENQGESIEDAAARELKEETNLPDGASWLEQLYTFGDPGRDPRMRVISVAFMALIRPDFARLVTAGDDARDARWFSVQHELPEALAFDHDHILDVGLKRIRGKIDYSPVAFRLVPPTFTIAELRGVHEAVKGTTYDPGNFRRRFRRMQTDGIIELALGKRQTSRRPAKVYRFTGVDDMTW